MMTALRILVYAVAVLAMNFPVIATLVTSFKSPREAAMNPSLWVEAPTLANYAKVLTDTTRFDIYAYLFNSLVAALIGTTVAIVLALPAAYGIARSGVGQRVLLPLVINLRAVPLIIFAIPIYMMYQWVGLLDTRVGLGLILAVVNLPLALVILVNAVAEVPAELSRSSRSAQRPANSARMAAVISAGPSLSAATADKADRIAPTNSSPTASAKAFVLAPGFLWAAWSLEIRSAITREACPRTGLSASSRAGSSIE